MLNGLVPYPEYRECNLYSLPEVPRHWEMLRAKVFLREVDERSSRGDEELLSVSHKTGVTPRSQKKVTMFLAETNVGHKICEPGDVVINTMWAWMAAAGVSRWHGLVSPSYGVYRLTQPDRFLWRYLDELLRTPSYRDEFTIQSTGITSSRLRLYPDAFLRIPLLCPPLVEQGAIVRYANRVDHALQSYVEARSKLLELLSEMRDAITEEAIASEDTRPHRLVSVADQVFRPIRREADDVYTPIGLYNRGRGIFHKEATRGGDLGDSTFYWLSEGDLVISGQFAWEGAIALAGPSEEGCVASHRFPVLRGKPGQLDAAYLLAFLRTASGQFLLEHHSRGAAGRNRPLNVNSLLKETVPVPPIAQQKRVSRFVHLESLVRASVRKHLTLLREYRDQMVAEAVTGRLDLRGMIAPAAEDLDVAWPQSGFREAAELLAGTEPDGAPVEVEEVEI